MLKTLTFSLLENFLNTYTNTCKPKRQREKSTTGFTCRSKTYLWISQTRRRMLKVDNVKTLKYTLANTNVCPISTMLCIAYNLNLIDKNR